MFTKLFANTIEADPGWLVVWMIFIGIGLALFALSLVREGREDWHRKRDHDLRLHEATIKAAGVDATRARAKLSSLPAVVQSYTESRGRLQTAVALSTQPTPEVPVESTTPSILPAASPAPVLPVQPDQLATTPQASLPQGAVQAEDTAIIHLPGCDAHVLVGFYPDLGTRFATLHFRGQTHNLLPRGLICPDDQWVVLEAERLGLLKVNDLRSGAVVQKKNRRVRKSSAA